MNTRNKYGVKSKEYGVKGKTPNSQLLTPHSKKGFTLIELMVTITIIGILAAVGLVVYASAQKSGRISKRVQDLKAIQTAVELYKTSNGVYPTQSVIATCANAGNVSTGLAVLAPSYMPAIPTDPLNNTSNCYKYQSAAGTEYKIWTSTNEMSANEYNTQAGMVDPFRDGVGGNCILEAIPAGTTASTVYAWALYSSKGTVSAADACGY